jgi:hypothetical protein
MLPSILFLSLVGGSFQKTERLLWWVFLFLNASIIFFFPHITGKINKSINWSRSIHSVEPPRPRPSHSGLRLLLDTNLIKSVFFFLPLLQNPTYATESEDSAPQPDPENDEKNCQTADLHWISPSQTIPSSSSADPNSVDTKVPLQVPQYFRLLLEYQNNYFKNIFYVWNFKT